MEDLFGKARLEYFFNHSQNRRLRRKMAKDLGFMKEGWQAVKDQFPPYNKPMYLGIKKFKKTGASHKDVVEYKLKAREAISNTILSKEA